MNSRRRRRRRQRHARAAERAAARAARTFRWHDVSIELDGEEIARADVVIFDEWSPMFLPPIGF